MPLADAQQAGKTYRIGYLAAGARSTDGAPPASLRQALQELGYGEGKNVIYEGRWAEARREELPALAAELVGLKVDLIITFGSPAAAAAKEASSTIPIVMALSGDPEGVGLVASLARPGGNVTGVTDNATALSAKRLELLKEAVPTASRIAVSGVRPSTSTRSSRGRSRASFRWSSQLGTTSWSTSRPLRRSGSRSRRRCCCARTR